MPFAELYKNIFEKNGPTENSRELLQELVKEYPYCSLAHFYLLQQTPETSVNYATVAAKTALHFNNPYFLQSQVRNATHKLTSVEIMDEEESAIEALVPDVKTDTAGDLLPDNSEANTNPGGVIADEMVASQNGESNNSSQLPVGTASENEPTPGEELKELAAKGYAADTTEDDINIQHEAGAPIGNEVESNSPPVAGISPQHGEEEIKYVPLDLPQDNMPEVKPTTGLAEIPGELKEVPTNNEGEPVADVASSPIKNLLSRGVPSQAPNTMLFEPLHATDYFASQGIKLREEAQPADKLGKQLKSFTEWLKTMKKVHEPGADVNTGNIDLSVQTLAEKSNKEEEILTEAMADVFMQQGKANKAKEIYQKLSLLNPAKSAYFAAKIDQIK